jgi:penicillin-binding protein 1A
MYMRTIKLVLRAIWLSSVCAFAVPLGVTLTILAAFVLLPLPASLPEARAPEGGQISYIYDINGNEIGQFRQYEQNLPVRKEDIPLHLKQAVIAAEDRNFYRHGGVDFQGSMRALVEDIRGREIRQGGSTITQQYVKNAYVGKDRTIVRKVREAILASQLDRQVDKDEILFRYLSTVFFGNGAYGVGAASETYFHKPVSEVTISEAALLVGLIPAPSRYEPRGNAELAETKRKLVLDAMLHQGYLTPEQHAVEINVTVWLYPSMGEPPGVVTIVHDGREFTETKYPYFVDYLRRYVIQKYGDDLVYKGGLRIQTTLDPKLQDAAQDAVANALGGTAPPIDMALASVEPPTGYVKALVGGRDYYGPQGKVNLALGHCPAHNYHDGTEWKDVPDDRLAVTASCRDNPEATYGLEGGGTGRQPGSSWKPIVLAAAFAKGISPNKVYSAPGQYQIPGTDDVVHNYEGSSGGSVTLRTGTVKSFNTVYAQVIQDVGLPETAEMAKKLGIRSAWVAPNFRHGVSYALGAQEVAPLDMASAYGVFAARGMRNEPTPVLLIKNPADEIIEDNRERDTKATRVIDEVIADNVTDVLRGVISGGTGTRANIGRPAAGKTGTAQEWRDAWFVGYTPTLSAAVWIGNKERPTPLYGIKGVGRVTGGSIPAATWKDFMSRALADVPVTDFNEPAPIQKIADELKREKDRTSIRSGARRRPSDAGDGGPFIYRPPSPEAAEPTTTTTTTPSGGDDDDDDDGGGGDGDDGGGGGGGGGPPTTLLPGP